MTDRAVPTLGGLRACLILLAMSLAAHAQANPARIRPLTDAPEALQPFLEKARAADAIKDPLARCLAFPDLPGNQWPAGLAKAHCELAHGPRITIGKVRQLLDAKAYAELDALYRADLEKHFAKDAPSEAIHRGFDDFDGLQESNDVTKRWLDNAPDSPFALAARGIHHGNAAAKARGGNLARETSDANFARMSLLADMAIDLLEKSLKREPRLLAAHEELIGVASLAGRADVGERAFNQGSAIDKHCRRLTGAQMRSLRPRWGGSYEKMAAYAVQLEPFQKERPLLALTLAEIPSDMATWVIEHPKHKEKIEFLLPAAQRSTFFGVHETLARSMTTAEIDEWTKLVYLLMVGRFFDDDRWITREKGRTLLYSGQAEWSLPALEKAARMEASDSGVRSMLAHAYFELQRWPEAEKAYAALLDFKETREEGLRGAFEVTMRLARHAKALEYAELLNKEHPSYAFAWFMRAWLLDKVGKRAGIYEALEKYVSLADPANPEEARPLAEAKRILAARKKK
ncbi:DUF4034 domain-containing protein [Pseudoduganella sp. GCM10020061]|uniref:DUF4034 domain-containing protein n=1 Tax=Pseudoduganella sp. GCM10020061 TaxID=3317345 RepID=UPI003641F8E0